MKETRSCFTLSASRDASCGFARFFFLMLVRFEITPRELVAEVPVERDRAPLLYRIFRSLRRRRTSAPAAAWTAFETMGSTATAALATAGRATTVAAAAAGR